MFPYPLYFPGNKANFFGKITFENYGSFTSNDSSALRRIETLGPSRRKLPRFDLFTTHRGYQPRRKLPRFDLFTTHRGYQPRVDIGNPLKTVQGILSG